MTEDKPSDFWVIKDKNQKIAGYVCAHDARNVRKAVKANKTLSRQVRDGFYQRRLRWSEVTKVMDQGKMVAMDYVAEQNQW